MRPGGKLYDSTELIKGVNPLKGDASPSGDGKRFIVREDDILTAFV
jgi:hypothetical protein